MSLAAVLGGFAEAGVLVLLARIAFALASSDTEVSVSLGPFGTLHVAVGVLIGVAAALVVVRMALQWASTVLTARATFSVVDHTRRSLVGLYLAAGWPLQATQREGRLQELLTTYVNSTSTAIASLANGATNAFSLAALLLTALAVNPIASLAGGLAALLIGLLLRPMRAALRRRSGRSASSNLDFATGITELTSALQEVRIFAVEPAVGGRLESLNERNIELSLGTAYLGGAIGVLYQGIAMLLMVGALGIAYAAGASGVASLGAIVLIMLRSLSYAQAIQSNIQALYQSAPYLQTLEEEADQYHQSRAPHGGRPVTRIGDLAFENVSFEYEEGTPVLREVSFHVPHGEVVGVVGPSGSGKSTLVQLLLRLREPGQGVMLVDGVDARELSIDDWYARVALVPQEPRLFGGTIADNIRFFREGIDDNEIERAAKRAYLHDDVSAWPRGYATPVGERGSQLSGGQRQRLCIARALAEEPDILILDEPTSSLDVRSEALIRETLSELAPHTTVFIVAHRFSTLAICSRIMVILDGALEGFDTPERLEATNPFYKEALRLSGMQVSPGRK
jgi:ABC-type multidrug transport system fused ATPase/permease subunit